MANDINPAVIKLTQDILGKYVKKPTLSEKLLKKPPFRFLHDVFAVVIRDTKCFEGLYTAEELNSDNIKDRDDKMRFLQKMIDVVRICTNVPLTVKTSKIVAGHEAEKTNELLQLMGKIIDGKLNWQPAVEQVLKGKDAKFNSDKPLENTKEKEVKAKEAQSNKNAAKIKQPSISKEDKAKRQKVKEKTPATKEKLSKSNKSEEKAAKKPKDSVKPKLAKTDSQNSHKSPTPKKQEVKPAKETKLSKNDEICTHEEDTLDLMTPSKSDSLESDSGKAIKKHEDLGQPPLPIVEAKLRNSAAKSRVITPEEGIQVPPPIESRKSSPKSISNLSDSHKNEDEVKNILSDPEKSTALEATINSQSFEDKTEIIETRDKTPKKEQQYQLPNNEVRRESTFTRENSKEIPNQANGKPSRPRTSLRPPSARPPSARPGAPRRRDRNVEIILQPNDQVKMSGIQVKLETFGDLEDDGENLVIIETVNANGMPEDADTTAMKPESGLETETIEQGHLVQQILETQKELTQQKDVNQQNKYEKDSVNGGLAMKQTATHHMNNLRDVIQNLTKSVNPLGKLMDFIPEDIDAMQLEFTMWRDAYTQAANQLKREKSLTESATEPMKNQLVQIEANILEYMEMIDASRVKIFQNNDKIFKMLTTS